ncbi:MAG: GNAT family N-acetyltransferase [Anaerolineae bacterium]|nr:GNAT family N-acetyltransferase [Anaerolineae bacterium]
MITITRLQAYLRHNARQQYQAVATPPFTCFFHPTEACRFFNYAIPDEPEQNDWGVSLAALRQAFRSRQRQPRLEFIEEFAPTLSSALRAAGFEEEGRYRAMICSAHTYQPTPEVAGLVMTPLTTISPLSEFQDYVTIERQGFDPDNTAVVTASDAQRFVDDLHGGVAFLARLNGQPVSTGMFTTPHDGLTEIVGLATLELFRRRGIATAVTALAVQTAFAQGVEYVYLSAADERAGRVYERVGFRPFAAMLAYGVRND